MAFHVQPATYSDLDDLAAVLVAAHAKDELLPAMLGKVPRSVQVNWYANEFRKVWEDESSRYYKVTETESGKIVAMARFHYPCHKTASEKAQEASNPFGSLPEGSQVELCQDFFEKLERCEAKHLNRENTYFVNYLATLPQYHRKGLGRLLINVCLRDADEDHANTFLIATPAGSGLYKKLGFKEMDRVSWDTSPYGGDGVVTWLCMMRHPNASEAYGPNTHIKMQSSTLKQVRPQVSEIHD